MFKGTVNFRAGGVGIAFDGIDVATHEPNTGGATVAANAEEVLLKVTVTAAETVDEAIRAAGEVAIRTATVLTYHFGKHFKNFGLVDHALVEDKANATQVHHFSSSLGFFVKADACLRLGPDKTAALKNTLDLPSHSGFLFYDQFRAALSLGDPLARFMSLYNIALSLCSDSQEDVDRLALQLDSSTPTNPPFKPRRSGTAETIYTRLRNQVGHVRPGTTIEGTRAEMEACLPGLIRIAKDLIDRQP